MSGLLEFLFGDAPFCKYCGTWHYKKDCIFHQRRVASRRERFKRFRNDHMPAWLDECIQSIGSLFCKHDWLYLTGTIAGKKWRYCQRCKRLQERRQ